MSVPTPMPNSGNRSSVIAAAFRRAIELAQEQEGATAPNPAVGCLLLDKGGKTLIAAAHLGAGKAHAEARAINLARDAGVESRIDTIIVTLEPCNHHGRTGPCADIILTTPAHEVWYGLPDPNFVAAGGADVLTRAGLRVMPLAQLDHPDTSDLLVAATRLLAPFATRITLGRPFITVKQALDASGSMIPPQGQKTFTSPYALTFAHRLRRRADAIITGSGTILSDRPEFTVRHVPDIQDKVRTLCILDRRGRVDQEYLAQAIQRGFRVRIVHDIAIALSALAQQGCNEVLIEAGPTLTQYIYHTGLWDEWVLIEQSASAQADRVTITSRNHSGRNHSGRNHSSPVG